MKHKIVDLSTELIKRQLSISLWWPIYLVNSVDQCKILFLEIQFTNLFYMENILSHIPHKNTVLYQVRLHTLCKASIKVKAERKEYP